MGKASENVRRIEFPRDLETIKQSGTSDNPSDPPVPKMLIKILYGGFQ